jgi:hypothetical protein
VASVQLPEPDLSGFAPVNILVNGRSLRETTGNIKDFIDKAAPERIWQFSIDVPDNLLEGVDQIWVPSAGHCSVRVLLVQLCYLLIPYFCVTRASSATFRP